jgi:hypothetical protein
MQKMVNYYAIRSKEGPTCVRVVPYPQPLPKLFLL